MRSYTEEEQAFLLYHQLLHTLFAVALHTDAEITGHLRRRIYQEMPVHIADNLYEVLIHIWEYYNDVQREDQ